MTNINYALELFSRIPFQHRYEMEDSLSKVISLMAYDHAQLGDFDSFKTIVTHSRFSDYCANRLFARFFSCYSYDSLPNPNLNKDKELVENNLDKAFSIFLELNKLSFGSLYKEHRSEYYYLIDPETDDVRSLSRIEALLDYVIANKIFISALSLDIDQLLHFENLELTSNLKNKITLYKKISKNDTNTHDLVPYFSGSFIDLRVDLESKIPFETPSKKDAFKSMLVIGLYFDKYKAVGEKNISYTEGDTEYCSSEPYFKQGIPDAFNNPYTNFAQCFTLLADAMDVEFSEDEKALALNIYQDIHKNHYKYD